jgi:geranylgeranylglycerol-phosphate geranylgeranyltransferase
MLYAFMASVLNIGKRQEIKQKNAGVKNQASFFSSQVILFNSRKKHGLLYSIATVAGVFCIPGILNAMGSETEIQLLIQSTAPLPLVTLMIAVGLYVLNDLVDADIDRVNSKNRPIPSGLVSKKQAWSFIILTNGTAVALGIMTLSLASTILLVPMMLIGILYSLPKNIALMNRFLLKNIAIALFYALCGMLGFTSSYGMALVIDNPIVAIHIMTISAIMIFVGSTINDLGDIKGDKASGRRTIPIVLGGKNTVRILIILLTTMPMISWLLYMTIAEQGSISTKITPIAVTVVATLAILRMTKIHKVFEDMKLMREQHKKWFPLYMLLQLAMVIGSFVS